MENRYSLLLCEEDIPGSSLKGRDPALLTVPELKRWLACRDASRKGKKAELVKRASDYLATGLDQELVDPNGGASVEKKLTKLRQSSLESPNGQQNVEEVGLPKPPPAESTGWISSLKTLLTVTYRSLYTHFMERTIDFVGNGSASARETDDNDIFSSYKGISKGYRFFKDGPVQKIQLHPVLSHRGWGFLRAEVLPSMRKTEPYKTWICLDDEGSVKAAYCVCTAGLAGSCNHVAGLLYALEEFVRLGLREEDPSPTSRLCKWNAPRGRKVAPLPVADVRLERAMYGVQKRPQADKHLYNPLPPNHRLVNSQHVAKLRQDLKAADDYARAMDTTGVVEKYGSSTFLTALETSSESKAE